MQTTMLFIVWISLFIELSNRSVFAGTPPNVIMNSTYFSWKAGQTVILRCYVSSTADAIKSVFWIFETGHGFKSITPSTNSDKYRGSSISYPSLIILNLTYADVGSYRCAATNTHGTAISKTALFLNVTGKSPNVTATRPFYNVKIGDNVTLGVSIYSPESVLLSVEWFFHHKGLKLKINVNASAKYIGSSLERPSLLIINLKTDDIGNYSCIAENSYGTGESEQMLLEIKDYLPLVNIEQQEYHGNLGRSIVITCSIASPDREINSVSWIFHDINNDLQIQIKPSSKYEIGLHSNPSLLIKKLTFSDEGLYKCFASNKFGTGYSNWTSLSVQDIPIVDIGSEAVNSSYGDSVTLECNVSSQSALNRIYWERNSSGNVIEILSELAGTHGVTINNPGLTINVTTSSDSGFYTCVAENSYGIGKSIPTQLNIKGGIPVVKAHETVINARYGMNITLHVTIDSAPEHFSIYWTKFVGNTTEIIHNGTIGTSGGTVSSPSLTICFPTASYVGIYKCYARNVLGTGSSVNISLVVKGDVPLVEVAVREHTAHFGEELTIQCNVKSYPVHQKVYWEKKNGNKVTTLTPQTKGIRGITIDIPSLTIAFVTSTDTGSYTCYAKNIVGVGNSRTTNLKVIAGAPIVNIGSVFYTTVFGIQITLECIVIADPPVRNVFWHKNVNGYLTSLTHGAVGTQGITPTSPSLTIMFPGKSDQGEYTCIAVNDLGQRGSLPTLLSVSGGLPEVKIGSLFHSAMFGESYTLHCNVHAVPLHTDIYWQHITAGFIRIIRKDTLGVSGVTLDDPTLTIDYVTTSDTGSYTCSAENLVGTGSSKSIHLKVDGDIPVVDVPLTSLTVKHGHDVALLCIVSSKPPHTNVYWIKDSDNGKLVFNHGTTGTIGMTNENPSLSLKPAIITDSGMYTCLASNVIGTGASRPISLIVTSDDNADDNNSSQGSSNQQWLPIVAGILTAVCSTIGLILASVFLHRCCGIGSTPNSKPRTGENTKKTNDDTNNTTGDENKHTGIVYLRDVNVKFAVVNIPSSKTSPCFGISRNDTPRKPKQGQLALEDNQRSNR